MSFPAVKRAKGSNQCKQILDHGYRAGENLPGASKHRHGKNGGLSIVSGGPTMNFLKERT